MGEIKQKKLAYRTAIGLVKILRKGMKQLKTTSQIAKENLIADLSGLGPQRRL